MLPPPPNSEIEHKCAQFRGSECSQTATTPFIFLPNKAAPASFCYGQLPPAPIFAKSSIQVLGLAKTNPAALVLSWPTTICPRFCQIEHLDAQFGKNKP